MGIPDHPTSLLRNLYVSQEATLELDMEQKIDSKLGKEYIKAVYCYPACSTYVQSTSCKMLGWMKHKLESRWLGEISITSDTETILMSESEEKLKSLLMKVKEESEKVGLKLNIQNFAVVYVREYSPYVFL